MSKLYIDLFAEKHLGRDQELNEDSYFCGVAGPASKLPPDILAVLGVADGMGGPDAGVVASTIATEHLAQLFLKGGYQAIAEVPGLLGLDYTALITEAFHGINQKIFDRSGTLQSKGPAGTTCVFGVIAYHGQDDKTYLHVGNVGNSRCYIVRGDQIFHATEDDTHAWQLYKTGKITYAEMLVHPLRQKTTAIGMKENVVPQVHSIELLQNDIVLFSTDGLHEVLDDTEIEYIINSSSSTVEAVKGLVSAAKSSGGTDDIAVALAYCSPTPMEPNAGYTAGTKAPRMTKRTMTLIAVWTAVTLLSLGAVASYFLIPTGKGPLKVFEPTLVSAKLPGVTDTLTKGASVDSTAVKPAVAIGKPAVPPTAVSVPAKQVKTETPFPQMSVEWIAETRRFRIKVRAASVIPVSVTYGGAAFEVAAVKSIPNMYKTTTPADVETAGKKKTVIVRLKGPEKKAAAVAFTIVE